MDQLQEDHKVRNIEKSEPMSNKQGESDVEKNRKRNFHQIKVVWKILKMVIK